MVERAKTISLLAHMALCCACLGGGVAYRSEYGSICRSPIDIMSSLHLYIFTMVSFFDYYLQSSFRHLYRPQNEYEPLLINDDNEDERDHRHKIAQKFKDYGFNGALVAATANAVVYIGSFVWYFSQCGFSKIGQVGWWYTVVILTTSLHCVVIGGTAALMLHHQYEQYNSYSRRRQRQVIQHKNQKLMSLLENLQTPEGPPQFSEVYQNHDIFWLHTTKRKGLDPVEMKYLMYYCTWPTQTSSRILQNALNTNHCILCKCKLSEDYRILKVTSCKHVYHVSCAMKWFRTSHQCVECKSGIRRFIFPDSTRHTKLVVFPPSYLPETSARIMRGQKEELEFF